jgi:chitin disaccharide deacetylase
VRQLIVNADDFGQSAGVNRGIERAHSHGIVTTASLMVYGEAVAGARDYARRTGLPLGLHLDLGEWAANDEVWAPVYEVVDVDDELAVAAEVRRQAAAFVELVGRDPTHIDSHQHVHRRPAVLSAALELSERWGAPLRDVDPRVHYCGSFYGQTADGAPLIDAISVDALLRLLAELPEGTTELGCHPGLDVELDTMYRAERDIEVASLCDPAVRDAIDRWGIQLCAFDAVSP